MWNQLKVNNKDIRTTSEHFSSIANGIQLSGVSTVDFEQVNAYWESFRRFYWPKNYKNLEICVWYKSEVLAQRCYVKQVFWKISRNLQENTRVSSAFQSLFLKNLSCCRPETLSKIPSTQVFYCEFSKVFQNTYLEYLWMAASEKYLRSNQNQHFIK